MKNWSASNLNNLIDLLNESHDKFNSVAFIEHDPVSIPHEFSSKEDREIAGFLAATLAWGQRITILKNTRLLLKHMDYAPYEFILGHQPTELKSFKNFKHRTFNGEDAVAFIRCLKKIYKYHGGLETIFTPLNEEEPASGIHISKAKKIFFRPPHPARTEKHFADPLRGSAAKRINMFLRWMVRSDKNGVDFGIWKSIQPSQLVCPLDVHTGRVARKLKLLDRKQNDWTAAVELTQNLIRLNPVDPIRFDFALFGLGVSGEF